MGWIMYYRLCIEEIQQIFYEMKINIQITFFDSFFIFQNIVPYELAPKCWRRYTSYDIILLSCFSLSKFYFDQYIFTKNPSRKIVIKKHTI